MQPTFSRYKIYNTHSTLNFVVLYVHLPMHVLPGIVDGARKKLQGGSWIWVGASLAIVLEATISSEQCMSALTSAVRIVHHGGRKDSAVGRAQRISIFTPRHPEGGIFEPPGTGTVHSKVSVRVDTRGISEPRRHIYTLSAFLRVGTRKSLSWPRSQTCHKNIKNNANICVSRDANK